MTTARIPGKTRPQSRRRRERIAQFIVDFTDNHGYPPTVREIATEFDVVVSQAHLELRIMEQDGMITRAPGSPRAIRVLQMKAPEVQL